MDVVIFAVKLYYNISRPKTIFKLSAFSVQPMIALTEDCFGVDDNDDDDGCNFLHGYNTITGGLQKG